MLYKKACAIIMAVITALSFFTAAYADMSTPGIAEIELVVTNPDGITMTGNEFTGLSDEGRYIPYGEKIVSKYEYSRGNSLYFEVEYHGETFSIGSDDVKKVNESVDLSEAVKLDTPLSFEVIAEEGAVIRNGPSKFFDAISTIPCKTTVTCEYRANDGEWTIPWCYVTYNGVGGWICTLQYEYNYEFASIPAEDSALSGEVMVIDDDVKLYQYPNGFNDIGWSDDNKGVSDIIPVGTILKYDLIYNAAKCDYVRTEYNGVEGWTITREIYNGAGWKGDTAIGLNGEIITDNHEGIKIYTEPFNQGEFTGEYLEYNTLAKSEFFATDYEYSHMGSYKITVNGKTGWIEDGDDIYSSYSNYDNEEESYTGEELTLYSDIDKNSSVVTTVPRFEEIFCFSYGSPVFIRYKDKTGWCLKEPKTVTKYEHDVMSTKAIGLYSDVECKEKIADIPACSEMKTIFGDYGAGYYYVNYNDLSGWISGDPAESVNKIGVFSEDKQIFSEPDSAKGTEDVLPKDTQCKILYKKLISSKEQYYYVEYGEKRAWIQAMYFDEVEPETTSTTINNEDSTETSSVAEAVKATDSVSPRTIIVICVVGAFIMAITAGASIIFIKKKKNNT